MKKRDLIIVCVVLAFGMAYNFVESGEVAFFKGCSISHRSIMDRKHPNPFPRDEVQFPGSEVSKLEIDNKAGSIEVNLSQDGNIHIKPEVRVYHRDSDRAGEIAKEISVSTWDAGGGKLRVAVKPEQKFPFNRVRVYLTVSVPKTVDLDLWNRYGDVGIDGTGKNAVIDNKHGTVVTKRLDSPLKIRHRHGKVIIEDIKGNVDLSTQHSRANVTEIMGLKLNCSHTSIYVGDVDTQTTVEYAAHSTLKLEGANGLSFSGRHTGLNLKDIKGGVKLSNSHDNIYMEDISGDVFIKARHCDVRIIRVNAGEFVVRNQYDDIEVREISSQTFDALISHGDLIADFVSMGEQINIKNRHSRIQLSYPASVEPAYNINLKYGKIKNNTPVEFSYLKERSRLKLNTVTNGPQVIITNTYGDVYLNHNRYQATKKESATDTADDVKPNGKINVETEEFKKPEEEKLN